jgi:hypothetical protein
MRLAVLSGVVGLVAMVFVASPASAWITVGETPPTSGSVTADGCGPGTYAVTSTAAPPRYEIPGDGVLTSWRTFATVLANVGPERLKVITPISASTFKVVATSAYANSWSTVDNAEVRFPTRIPVRAGDLIALGVGPTAATQSQPHCLFNHGTGGQWRSKVGIDDPADEASVLTWGPLPASPDYRVSVSAALEPDGDHDGFGDETQDQCVTAAGANDGCPPAPPPPTTTSETTTPPPAPLISLSGLTIAPRSFPASPSGPSALAARRSFGAKVGFTLSATASVRFTVVRLKPGRRAASGRCVAATPANRRAHTCTRTLTQQGGFNRAGLTGSNSFRFSGRMRGKRLTPGRYRLIATPNVASQTGSPTATGFRIIR